MSPDGFVHSDQRRDLYSIYNEEFANFVPKHVKLYEIKQNCFLGGHKHPFTEFYTLVKGKLFFLVFNEKQKLWDAHQLQSGEPFLIEEGLPHCAYVEKGSVFVGGIDGKYVSANENDIPTSIPFSKELCKKIIEKLKKLKRDSYEFSQREIEKFLRN